MYRNLDELPITFGVSELAEVLNISRNKAYDIIKDDSFPKHYIGRKSIFLHGWIKISVSYNLLLNFCQEKWYYYLQNPKVSRPFNTIEYNAFSL